MHELFRKFPYKKALTKGESDRFVYLQALTFGAFKLAQADVADPLFVPRSWDYPTLELALEALKDWDGVGEPMAGWTRRTDLEGNHYPDKLIDALIDELNPTKKP